MDNNYSTKDKIVVTILTLIIIIGVIIFFKNIIVIEPKIDLPYDLTGTTGGLPYPVQTDCAKQTFDINVDGTTVKVTKVAKYKIIGRVESISYHVGINSILNKISTRDFQLSYGEIALNRNSNRIKFSSKDRYGIWYCDNQDFYKEYGSFDIISVCVSNNHLIPANKNLKDEIERVQIGDVVEINGYLSTYEWYTDEGKYFWGTSLTRDDTGDKACETIYVEDFKIIQ